MRRSGAALVVAGIFLTLSPAVRAQNPAGSFVGTTPNRPGCPSVTLHIIREGVNLTGVAFYTNGSGVSTIKGQVSNGNISWSQTPIRGHGPTGQVNGSLDPSGVMKLNLTGTTCSFQATLPLTPLYSNVSGG